VTSSEVAAYRAGGQAWKHVGLRLQPDLWRRAKITAVERGVTLQELVIGLLTAALDDGGSPRPVAALPAHGRTKVQPPAVRQIELPAADVARCRRCGHEIARHRPDCIVMGCCCARVT
jgi:hypothetical protein